MGAIAKFKKRRDAEKAAKAKLEQQAKVGVDLVNTLQALNNEAEEVSEAASDIDNSANELASAAESITESVDGAASELSHSTDDIASATAELKDVVEEVKKPSAAQPSSPSKSASEQKNSSTK